jgi:hypothetical protein
MLMCCIFTLQFMSWIYPLSPYIANDTGNLRNPPDLAIFVMRSLRENRDNTLNDGDIDRAVKSVSLIYTDKDAYLADKRC